MAEARQKRGIEFQGEDSRSFDFDPSRRLQAGDILHRGAVSVQSSRVEHFLYREGVSTFYADGDAIHFTVCVPPDVHEPFGAPVAETVYVASDNRELLAQLVERVGGFPVVLKVAGR